MKSVKLAAVNFLVSISYHPAVFQTGATGFLRAFPCVVSTKSTEAAVCDIVDNSKSINHKIKLQHDNEFSS